MFDRDKGAESVFKSIEQVARSEELRQMVKAGLEIHIANIRRFNTKDVEGERQEVTEDLELFGQLGVIVERGFVGREVRDVTLRRGDARINFARSQDLQSNRRHLNLFDGSGKPRKVTEQVVQMRKLQAGDPSHRRDISTGHYGSTENVSLRSGFEITIFSQEVSVNTRTEDVNFKPLVGVCLQFRDSGEIKFLPQKYTGRLSYDASPIDLTLKFPKSKEKIAKPLKEILV